jgi:hypothetical protein
VVSGMTIKNLVTRTVGVGLLLLTGCEAPRTMRDDYLRLTASHSAAPKTQPAKSTSSDHARRNLPLI